MDDWIRCKDALETLGYDYAPDAGVPGQVQRAQAHVHSGSAGSPPSMVILHQLRAPARRLGEDPCDGFPAPQVGSEI